MRDLLLCAVLSLTTAAGAQQVTIQQTAQRDTATTNVRVKAASTDISGGTPPSSPDILQGGEAGAKPIRYLNDLGIDLLVILPPAPQRGTPRYTADRQTFRETRRLLGTPRAAQAVADVREDVPTVLAGFSPAAGQNLSPATQPHLAFLLAKMRPDISAAVNSAKDVLKRRRPFLVDRGETCQPKAQLEKSFDYPSGHTT